MRGPFGKVGVHEAPGAPLGVDLNEHVGVGIVPRGGHDVVLRSVGMGEVDPFVQMARDYELDIVFVFAQ